MKYHHHACKSDGPGMYSGGTPYSTRTGDVLRKHARVYWKGGKNLDLRCAGLILGAGPDVDVHRALFD